MLLNGLSPVELQWWCLYLKCVVVAVACPFYVDLCRSCGVLGYGVLCFVLLCCVVLPRVVLRCVKLCCVVCCVVSCCVVVGL